MTQEEFIAKRFASQLQIAKQNREVEDLSEKWQKLVDQALAEPRQKLQRLEDADEEQHEMCLNKVDFLPFTRYDFITHGNGIYYEVGRVDIHLGRVEPGDTCPPDNFLRLYIRGYAICQSGALARHYSRLCILDLTTLNGYRKAEVSEDLRLRRAVKQRMRRRLEGGE